MTVQELQMSLSHCNPRASVVAIERGRTIDERAITGVLKLLPDDIVLLEYSNLGATDVPVSQ